MALRALFTLGFVILAALPLRVAHADGKIGPEWTFTRDELIELGRKSSTSRDQGLRAQYEETSASLRKRWLKAIQRRCPVCKIDFPKGKVQYDGAHWIQIFPDPWVLEVIASPMTLKELETQRNTLQSLVWDSAIEVGLSPHYRVGGGHIHLDLASHFGDDALLFRNFLVDLANHPEPFMGPFGYDYLNGPPLAILPDSARREFEKLLRRFDEGGMTLQQLKFQMSSRVYQTSFLQNSYPHVKENPEKYQFLNLEHANTVEIRGLRPQLSMDHYIKMARLFEARIDSLRKLDKPIPNFKKNYSNLVSSVSKRGMENYTTNIDPRELEASARDFVTQSGLDWADYKHELTEEFQERIRHVAAASPCADSFGKLKKASLLH